MTVKMLTKGHAKRELLNLTINKLRRWVDTKLVFTDKVKVLIEPTYNGDIDDISIQFVEPCGAKPGPNILFLCLHYKDADTRLEGNHFRFNHPLYGLHDEFCQDTWAKSLPLTEEDTVLVAHHAIMRLASVLEEIRNFCDAQTDGWQYFDPKDSTFCFITLLGAYQSIGWGADEYERFRSLFE